MMYETNRDLVEELQQEMLSDGSSSMEPTTTDSSEVKLKSMDVEKTVKTTYLVALLVVVVGAVAAGSFLQLGISSAKQNQEEHFERRASDMAKEISGSWHDYESATLWIHETCRKWRETNFTYKDFEVLYEYVQGLGGGLDFYEMQWVPNVTHDERKQMEAFASIGWNTVPGMNFTTFTGMEPDPEDPNELIQTTRSEQPFYFPLMFGEPKSRHMKVPGYDLFSPPWERPSIEKALDTYQPSLTGRFLLRHHTTEDGYSCVLYNPGKQLPEEYNVKPKDLSNMVIHVKSLLTRAVRNPTVSLSVFLYDTTSNHVDPEELPEFLSGLEIHVAGNNSVFNVIPVPETEHVDVKSSSTLYFERDMFIGGRYWTVVVVPIDGTFEPDLTAIILCGSLILVASVLLAVWMIHNTHKSIKLHRVITKAAAEASIVANLFPANVRDRMLQDVTAQKFNAATAHSKNVFLNKGDITDERGLSNFLSSEGIFGSKPIADLHPYTTVMFADMVGFTSWSSMREPSQVFTLLEVIYSSFDSLARTRRVYKVETVGDCYVAVSGLPQPRDDHAVAMSRFASDCLQRMQRLVKALEKSLGPDTGDLGLRVGLHSGQVTAGVLRGDKGRFQLFGDCMNMAARMESTGVRNRIQLSQETADLLIEAGRGKWVIPREEKVEVHGKGTLQTYFLHIISGSKASSNISEVQRAPGTTMNGLSIDYSDDKVSRLIEWNVEILSSLLKKIVARRCAASSSRHSRGSVSKTIAPPKKFGETVLDEVKEIITLPPFDEKNLRNQVDPNSIKLDPIVVKELTTLVTKIAGMYRNNPFHCFEHAAHVVMSVVKMMARIVNPKDTAFNTQEGPKDELKPDFSELHNQSFGITSDALTQFACVFSALIHDVDHRGVPNTTLVKEKSALATKYKNKSVAEQNSVDLAWELLMGQEFAALRSCICCNEEEFFRFRSLVVNSVMATDIMDKELGAARKNRWNVAFSEDIESQEPTDVAVNRKATIVIEHLIQASDVSHTMQHWHIYVKWNERLFLEMYKAYKEGHIENDPSISWHEGEIGFFDFYIIPLAKKLFKCGVFGVSSDEYLNYALINRKEWARNGAEMVQQYIAHYENAYENDEVITDKNVSTGNLNSLMGLAPINETFDEVVNV